MDIFDVASYFDRLTATDAYSAATLFYCQMDQYDSAERDSATSWRRSCSAASVVVPARKVLIIGGEVFLLGNVVKEYFEDRVIREHAVLHPSDGVYQKGTAKQFLTDPQGVSSFYGAKSFKKAQKEEGESSEVFPEYDIYINPTDTCVMGNILEGPDGMYYRVLDRVSQTSGYDSLFAAELGASALLSAVTYVSSSGYDVTTDLSGAEAPITLPAFLERYQTNYRYMTWSSEKYQDGDKVLTVNADDVPSPQNNDRVVADSVNYRVLSAQSDGAGCWELHIRQAEFNLSVET